MSPPPTAASADAAELDPQLLARLFGGLLDLGDDAHRSDPPAGGGFEELAALGVGVVGSDPLQAELAVHLLDPGDPTRSLYGFTAPATWSAFGVVAGGTARHLDRSGPTARVRLAFALSRSGRAISLVRPAPADPVDPTDRDLADPVHPADPVQGRIPDACRRVLGLRTAPPTHPVIELWAAAWLERVLIRCLAETRALPWPEVVGAFPGLSGVGRPAGDDDLWRDLLAEGELAADTTWEQLRTSWARQGGGVGGPGWLVEPQDAAWMDDGMFSREVLGDLPPVEALLVDLGALVEPSVGQRIERSLWAWGLA